MIGLTHEQRRTLLFIHERLSDTGVPPSFDEIASHLGLKSKSGVHRLVSALEFRGYIQRVAGLPRSISVLQLPAAVEAGRVHLNSEILALTDRYAAEHKISRDTAVNEALRQWFGAAA